MPEEVVNEKEQIEENPIEVVKRVPIIDRTQITFDNKAALNYLKVIYGVNLRGSNIGMETYFPYRQSAVKTVYLEKDSEKGKVFRLDKVLLVNGITRDSFEINSNDVANGRVNNNEGTQFASLQQVLDYLLKETAK
jgi:hypothetical protein